MAGDIIKLQYLRDMRRGTLSHKTVVLGDGDDSIKVAVVLLSADKMLDINERVDQKYGSTDNNQYSKVTRTQYYNMLLCAECLRDPDNHSDRIVEAEDVGELLNLEDIRRICEAYNELIVNKAPKLERMTEEDFDSIKKFLNETTLKDLSTVSQVHLTYFLRTIRSEE